MNLYAIRAIYLFELARDLVGTSSIAFKQLKSSESSLNDSSVSLPRNRA